MSVEDHVLDPAVAIGIEGGGRLIEQQQFGIGRQGPGDAQPLLLAAGELERRLVQPVLHFVPQGGRVQGLLDLFLEH